MTTSRSDESPSPAWPVARDFVVSVLLVVLAFSVSLAWGQSPAQKATVSVHKVEVFATVATQVSSGDAAGYPVTFYRLDELELAQRALLAPAGTGRTQKETEVLQAAYLREQGKAAMQKLSPLISRHYQAEQLVRQYGITAFPAIVINGSKVIYDVTDIGRAVALFKKLQGKT